jgi:hypothetical protein
LSFKLFDLYKRRSVAQLLRQGGVPARNVVHLSEVILCGSELAPGGVPTMDSSAPRLASKYALSLTTIASKLAPTEDHIRLTEQH